MAPSSSALKRFFSTLLQFFFPLDKHRAVEIERDRGITTIDLRAAIPPKEVACQVGTLLATSHLGQVKSASVLSNVPLFLAACGSICFPGSLQLRTVDGFTMAGGNGFQQHGRENCMFQHCAILFRQEEDPVHSAFHTTTATRAAMLVAALMPHRLDHADGVSAGSGSSCASTFDGVVVLASNNW